MSVRYRFISRYPFYRFGSDGSVWCWKPKRRYWKELTPLLSKSRPDPYPTVYLANDETGKRENKPVHTLIAEAFIGQRGEGLVCRHLNGDKLDSRVENLAYGTYEENEADKRRHGRGLSGERHHQSKLTESDVREILISEEMGIVLAARYGVTPTQIASIRNGRSWKHVKAQMLGPGA